MNWRIKAILQKVLSFSNIGNRINHLAVIYKKDYYKHVLQYQFYECIRKFKLSKIDLTNNKLNALEIGTGYSIVAPITLYLLGFDKIITVDISNDISLKSFKKQILHLYSKKQLNVLLKESIYTEIELINKIDKIISFNSLTEIFSFCNIIYIPNYNFDDIDTLGYNYDYIYSQVVFEHIQPKILVELFSKIKKWLKPKGQSVHTINFIDHFANPGFFQDKSISEFNFLQYSDNYWKSWTNNDIAYTNRLSYLFYVNLCTTNNFNDINFIGENYRIGMDFSTKLIHNDVLNKYKNLKNLEELIKYQRGTLVFQN